MTYATGDQIRAADYNQFAIGAVSAPPPSTIANAGLVWGSGYGRYGIGQDTTVIRPVATGNLIRAQEWDNMDAVLQAMTEHQQGTGTYTSPGPVVAGALIRPVTHFPPFIQAAYNKTGTSFINVDGPARPTSYGPAGIWGHTGSRALRFVQTFSFNNADDLRHYFNAGGKIKLSFTHTGLNTSARNTFWTNMCLAAGTIIIGHNTTTKVGGNGTFTPGLTDYGYGYGGGSNGKYTVLGAAGGFWANAAGVPKLHFKQYGTTGGYGYGYGGYGDYGGYGYGTDTDDYITVELRVTGAAGVNGGLGSVLEITTKFENALVVTPASADQVIGTSTVSAVLSAPDTNYLLLYPWTVNTFNGVVSPT